jgi:hypothetical protein
VSRFAQQAQQLLDTAESGESCSEMTILISGEGGIRLFADSDWPLDSLAREHGARTAYRVSHRDGSVRVEGREGSRKCVLESTNAARAAHLLLGGAANLGCSRLSGGSEAG